VGAALVRRNPVAALAASAAPPLAAQRVLLPVLVTVLSLCSIAVDHVGAKDAIFEHPITLVAHRPMATGRSIPDVLAWHGDDPV